MLRINPVVDRDSCFLPLVSHAAYIPKVFSSEMRVAVSALLDHGVLRQFLIDRGQTKPHVEGKSYRLPAPSVWRGAPRSTLGTNRVPELWVITGGAVGSGLNLASAGIAIDEHSIKPIKIRCSMGLPRRGEDRVSVLIRRHPVNNFQGIHRRLWWRTPTVDQP